MFAVRLRQILVRNGAGKFMSTTTTGTYQEVRIPVPWGHLAGKWWGSQNQRPILSFHGWQDCCGTFDRLFPLMPKHMSFLTVDFAGHGHSSRLPPGMFYDSMTAVMTIEMIARYFEWDKVSLMGHSMGAITSYTYGCLFPAKVDFLVCIDGLHPLISAKGFDRVPETIDQFFRYLPQSESKSEPPCYTMDELIERLHKATRRSIDKNNCIYILQRNITPSTTHPDKFYFHRDPRVKCGPLVNWPVEMIYEAARRVTFPLFVSKAQSGPFYDNKEYMMNSLAEIEKVNKNFEFHSVAGTHHAHLNQPEVFTEILTAFIGKHDTFDRSNSKMPVDITFINS